MTPRKVDVNQPEIVDNLRRLGYSVAVTSDLGKGFPDIIAGKHGRNWLFEIKNPEYDCKLTEAEEQFHAKWRGQIDVIRSAAEALEIMAGTA